MTTVASYLGPVTVGAHHVVQSTYMFFCTCGDAVSQAAQSFLPGVVRPEGSLVNWCLPSVNILSGLASCGQNKMKCLESRVAWFKSLRNFWESDGVANIVGPGHTQRRAGIACAMKAKLKSCAAVNSQVGKPKAAQNLGKQLMTTGLIVGCFNSICAGATLFNRFSSHAMMHSRRSLLRHRMIFCGEEPSQITDSKLWGVCRPGGGVCTGLVHK
jgi:hypothetical protein